MKRTLACGISAMSLVAMTGLSATVAQAAPADTTTSSHGTGLDLGSLKRSTSSTTRTVGTMATPKVAAATLPASADLTRYALTAGDQGRVNSCVGWATGYSGYGVLMNEQGIQGAPMAPMFTYAQIVKGNDRGTNAEIALSMQTEQGIDTRAHYSHGDYDFTSQPTAAERANAANYKLSGYQDLPTQGDAAKQAIMQAIASGSPVPIGMQIRQNFQDIDASTAADYSYTPAGGYIGGHETTIVAYNDKGVKVLNSWGPDWGDHGYYTLPWSFVNWGDLMEVHAMGKVVQANPQPAPAPAPTATATPTATPEPVRPTATPTPAPTEDPTTDPTAQPSTDPSTDPWDPSTDPWEDFWNEWDNFWN